MALSGDLQHMAVADLIQYICQDRKPARLVIEHQDQEAALFFNEGAVHHAILGQLEGEEVIYEVLSWQEGQFTLEMGQKPPVITIKRSFSGLLLEGARRLDEAQHNMSKLESEKESRTMANIKETMGAVMEMDGALAVALVDWNSGMTLGTAGNGMNIEMAAAGNTNVVRSKMNVMKDLKIKGGIEDILITLSDQYHLIRMLQSNPNLFLYVALSRAQANLGLARHKLAELEKQLTV